MTGTSESVRGVTAAPSPRELGTYFAGAVIMIALLTIVLDWTGTASNPELVAQVVPAIVVALFVFAAGTTFVVAQLVLPSRGARAVGHTLNGRRLYLASSTGLALLVGTVVLLVLGRMGWFTNWAGHLASALASATLVNMGLTTWFAIHAFRLATDPEKLKNTLAARAERLLGKSLSGRVADQLKGSFSRWDRLYDLVRTYRAWIRTAVMSGDSRELHFSLEGLLEIVDRYCEIVTEGALVEFPGAYPGPIIPRWQPRGVNGEGSSGLTSPLQTQAQRAGAEHPSPYDAWSPPLRGRVEGGQDVWLANECGRALVRAIEFGLQGGNLLDRDLLRLFNTMENAARLFLQARQHDSVGVLIRYLVDIGLAVRWYGNPRPAGLYGPVIRLALLHQCCLERMPASPQGPGKAEDPVRSEANNGLRSLLVGTLAGLLVIADSWAQAVEKDVGQGRLDEAGTDGDDPVVATVANLSVVLKDYGVKVDPGYLEEAVALAHSRVLEPRSTVTTQRSDEEQLRGIALTLRDALAPEPP